MTGVRVGAFTDDNITHVDALLDVVVDDITCIEYMYRDASNYKQHAVYEVHGYDEALLTRLRAALDERDHFIPELVGMPNPREEWDSHYEDDHVWNELETITCGPYPYSVPTYERSERTLENLVVAFEQANTAGWPIQDALERLAEFERNTAEGH